RHHYALPVEQPLNAVEVLGEATAEVIRRALDTWVNGPFIEDWEFATVTGLSRSEAASVASSWPRIRDHEQANQAVLSALGNLIGYPHGLSLDDVALTEAQLRDAREQWVASTLAR